MKQNELTISWINWINTQGVTWAKFTLHYPQFNTVELWSEPLKIAFKILSNTYPKSTLKKNRVRMALPKLGHITFLGGDTFAGVALHAQGLIEVLDNDLTRLNCCLHAAWVSAVRKQLSHQRQQINNSKKYESKVWVGMHEGSVDSYFRYLSRKEGLDLGLGVQKIVLSATALNFAVT